jgi:AcrR family transcriptional regulator
MDVAREVGTSPATFYQYFADVEDAIFALALELPEKVAPIQTQFESDWSGPAGLDLARQAVSDYTDFWDENAAVLRVLLLRADERDERFRQVRRDYNAPFLTAMVAKVHVAQDAGKIAEAIDAEATAGAMLAALDRLPNYREGFEKRGTTREAMIETVARLLHSSLTGEPLS